jgi:uncharacterized protein
MIDKNTLFRIFDESKEKYRVKLKQRETFDKIVPYIDYKEIIVFSGVRRCGKTSLMYSLMQYLDDNKKDISKVYINFEDERLAFLEPSDLDKIFEYYIEYENPKGKIYFFLDEIQNVKLWEKWLNRSYEKYKFIISGSNAKLLSSELSTALTGRHKEFHVYPFRFKEFISEKKISFTVENIAYFRRKFDEYLSKGGFPESLLNNKTDLLQDYYRNILFKDVIGRHNIKHKSLIEKLSLFILSNSGKTISLYKLEKDYDAGINTIKNYVSYLESAFLIFSINFFSFSLKKQQYNPPKMYSIDVALSNSIAFKISDNKGRMLENVVLIDLKARDDKVYYHKDKKECDFVIKKGNKIVEAIQVCYDLDEDNKKREIDGLLEALEKFKLKQGLILTYDQEDEILVNKKKILVKPVWKWILDEE